LTHDPGFIDNPLKKHVGNLYTIHVKFEDGIKRLEEIVGILDEGEVSLDEALNLFKEGLLLTKDLSKRLDEIEKKVEILIKKENGSVAKKPFLQEET
jgi:exodeoxyribonuclease VII small subunit